MQDRPNPQEDRPMPSRAPDLRPRRSAALALLLPLAATIALCALGPAGKAQAQTSAARPGAAAASAAAPARSGGGSGAEQACRAADHNHDGYIGLDEYHRDIARSWAALGPDATGYVKLEDLAAIPGLRRSVLERLRRADADGDGRLSFKEVVTARMAQFDAADLDRDDRLSMKECVDHERKLAAELRAQRPRQQP